MWSNYPLDALLLLLNLEIGYLIATIYGGKLCESISLHDLLLHDIPDVGGRGRQRLARFHFFHHSVRPGAQLLMGRLVKLRQKSGITRLILGLDRVHPRL